MDALISRLNERIRRSPAVEMDAHCVYSNDQGEVLPPKPPNSRITLADVEYVEHQLGFRLPQIVRRLSMEVADGGYGPNWGLNRLRHPPQLPSGPFWDVKMSVKSWHRLYHEGIDEHRLAGLPVQFIRYCEVGCNISICVDCSSESGTLFVDDPNDTATPLKFMQHSIEEWLWEWLDKQPWPTEVYS